MNKKEYINTLASHVVFTIDNLFKDNDYPQELLNYLYLIAFGMIMNYGDEYIEDIYNTISNAKYNLEDNSYHIESTLFYLNPSNHNYRNKFVEISSFNNFKLNYELQFRKIDSSNIKTLEYLTHELNYILFSKKHISFKDNLKVRFNFLTNSVVPLNCQDINNKTIDKVFNILQTEDLIKQILFYVNKDIKNLKFKSAIKLMKNVDLNIYKMDGLDILVNLIRPLYDIEDTKILINSLSDRKLLEKEFDSILGKNSYKEICKKIESLNMLISNSNNNNNYYILSCEYVALKKDFINKYINMKYA